MEDYMGKKTGCDSGEMDAFGKTHCVKPFKHTQGNVLVIILPDGNIKALLTDVLK